MRSLVSGSPAPPQRAAGIVVARFDDLLAAGLRELIASDPSLALLAEDVEQKRISVVLRAHRPDVAILDLRALTKLADVRELSIGHPATRFVLLADEPSGVECAQLLAFGASACLGRDTQARDVLSAIHLASRGLQVLPRSPSAEATAGSQLLTRREAEVLALLQQGHSNSQIASDLQVGVETVRTHARNVYRKLGVSSRRELVAPAVVDRPHPPSAQPRPARRRVGGRRSRTRGGHDAGRT